MTTSSASECPSRRPARPGVWIPVLVAVVLTLLLFGPLWLNGQYHFTTDNNIGQTAVMRAALQAGGWFGQWNDSELLGVAAPSAPGWLWGLMWLLPVGLFHNLIHTVDLTLASLFLALFLRRRGIIGWAAALGILTAFWVGTFTISYAGHIGKFGVMMFAPAFLWLADRAAGRGEDRADRARRFLDLALAGGALGLMFSEQADLALYVALLLSPYLPFAFLRERPGRWGRALVHSAVAAAVALLVATPALWAGYRAAVSGVAVMENPAAKWEYVTQWSFPPEEALDFLAPGFFGWRSGDPEGPYWGRIGRSEGWEKTHQGLMNFRLDSSYLGLIPVALGLLALGLAVFNVRRDAAGKGARPPPEDAVSAGRADAIFWGVVALAALALAMGKYSPLYKLFYLLPGVSSVRAPVKMLHVFQLAAGILAAAGAQAVWIGGRRQTLGWFARGLFTVGVVLGLGALMLVMKRADWVAAFAREGWGDAAAMIVAGQTWALAHAALLALLAGSAVTWAGGLNATPRHRTLALAALVVLGMADAFLLGRRFVTGLPRSAVAESELIRTLKQSQPMQRCALLTQEGFYNHWLTYLLPFHGVRSMNMTQMPRMSDDYKALLERLGRNPVRLWDVGGVDLVLAPAQAWDQIQKMDGWKDRLERIGGFDVAPDPSGQYALPVSVAPGRTGSQVILRLRSPVPRYALCSAWATRADDQALARLADPAQPLPGEVAVAPESKLTPPPAGAVPGPAGRVRVLTSRPGRVELEVEADRPALLRIADKYDPEWRAWVDGRPTPLVRADFMLQAVPMETGSHRVLLAYRPSRVPLASAGAGLLVILAGLGATLITRRRPPVPVAA